jgi:sulfatase maturation enzyme AslB (radical SAM superfamily)
MKFCKFLLEDINFEPTAVQPCCDVHALGVPGFPFHGGPLDIRSYRRHINDTFWDLQKHTDTCSGCPHLRNAEISFDDEAARDVGKFVKLRSVSFNQHRFYCNCRCVYCSLWGKKDKGEVYPVLPAVQSLVDSGILHDTCFFSWGGGEPSILKEFDETCAWIQNKNYAQYVHTNGLRYSSAIAGLLKAGKGRLNISLDSGSREKYREVKGVDAWDKVISNLERYASVAAYADMIDLKYIIFNATNNRADIDAFLNICKSISINTVQYSLDFREVNAASVTQKTLTDAVFFQQRASELGLSAVPFFIDAPYLEKMDAIRKLLYGCG